MTDRQMFQLVDANTVPATDGGCGCGCGGNGKKARAEQGAAEQAPAPAAQAPAEHGGCGCGRLYRRVLHAQHHARLRQPADSALHP